MIGRTKRHVNSSPNGLRTNKTPIKPIATADTRTEPTLCPKKTRENISTKTGDVNRPAMTSAIGDFYDKVVDQTYYGHASQNKDSALAGPTRIHFQILPNPLDQFDG